MPSDLFASVILLLILLDPLGNIPLLIPLLRSLPEARRQRVILRECLIAGMVLVVFVFVGDWVLAALRLSESALEISGGLILFLIALGMVFPRNHGGDAEFAGEPLIVPIAIPMIAGPAALATVLLTARQAERQIEQLMTLVAAIVIAMILNTLILLAAGRLARIFGTPGLAAMERLMGLALTTMAVQMLISGIKNAFLSGPLP